MIKKTFILFLVLSLTHCGFSPIYNSNVKSDYEIIIYEMSGDKYINNFINNNIKSISNINSKNKYKLSIDTKYQKLIISKDSKGSPAEYELSVTCIFTIENNNQTKTISMNEKQNIKNISDIFELKNYENSIKENFANTIMRKLNLEIINY
tara:strand:- start:971 stop:1423 length:453 start_codon:yes stop_codon:yes gene_type:complete